MQKPTAQGDTILNSQVQTPHASEPLGSDSSSAKQGLPEEQAGHIPCPACRGAEILDALQSWADPG